VRELLDILADGKFHSGTEIGTRLRISRAAVCKQVEGLRNRGLDIFSVRGKGYRLSQPIEMLDERQLRSHIDPGAEALIGELQIHAELDSTNRHLMEGTQAYPHGSVCLAERQTAGRGRRGRRWISPFGSNLYLSMLWRFDKGAAALSGLSLALGVAAVEALESVGAGGARLKWPNDILWQGRKMGGILVEVSGESEGPCSAVVGVGLNVRMPHGAEEEIGQPWAEVAEIGAVGRNRLAGALISALARNLHQFEHEGLGRFVDAWSEYHAHRGEAVRLLLPDRTVEGRALGIDESGALLLDVGGDVRRYASGEISLRPLETR